MKRPRRRASTPSTACRSCYHLAAREGGGGWRCLWLDVAILDPREESCVDFIDRARGGDVEGGLPCAGWTGGRLRQLDFLAALDNSTNEAATAQASTSSTR